MLSQPRSTEPRPVLNKIGVVDVGAASYGVQEQRLAVVDHARASLFAIMAKSGDSLSIASHGPKSEFKVPITSNPFKV